jgi:hypothetical protein
MVVPNDELLRRFGTDAETAQRLGEQAAMAERALGIHGVSVTARASKAPARTRLRAEVEREFPVHDTPSRRDPHHRTVELPKPVTDEVATRFNELFRIEGES